MEPRTPANGTQGIDAARPDIPARQSQLLPAQRRFHQMILRAFLSTGRPPQTSGLRAAAAELDLDVDAALGRLAAVDLVQAEHGGRVVVAYPFSARDTGIRVRPTGGPEIWAMCAIDALGIPQMARCDATIEASDPRSHDPVRVDCSRGRWSWRPSSTVVLVAGTGHGGTLAQCSCPLITFHVSKQNALDYLNGQLGATGGVLSKRKAHALAGKIFSGLLTG
jgi:hypothetical protein